MVGDNKQNELRTPRTRFLNEVENKEAGENEKNKDYKMHEYNVIATHAPSFSIQRYSQDE